MIIPRQNKNEPNNNCIFFSIDERSNILTSYLEDLERRGPPPPPTASEPQRRSAKI